MPLPLIGLTISRSSDDLGTQNLSTPEAYAQAVAKAGGVPILIPLGLSKDAYRGLSRELMGFYSPVGEIFTPSVTAAL